MRRRTAMLLTLAVCGASATALAPLSSAAPGYPPEPCPPQRLVYQENGNYYVNVPVPASATCQHIVVEVPGSIKPPSRNAPTPVVPPGFPPPCPVQPFLYESNGHDYLSVPDPTGRSCRIVVELPVTIPPTLA